MLHAPVHLTTNIPKAFTKTSKEDSKAKHFSQGKFDHSQPEDGSLREIW
jgi:hypothetical protein